MNLFKLAPRYDFPYEPGSCKISAMQTCSPGFRLSFSKVLQSFCNLLLLVTVILTPQLEAKQKQPGKSLLLQVTEIAANSIMLETLKEQNVSQVLQIVGRTNNQAFIKLLNDINNDFAKEVLAEKLISIDAQMQKEIQLLLQNNIDCRKILIDTLQEVYISLFDEKELIVFGKFLSSPGGAQFRKTAMQANKRIATVFNEKFLKTSEAPCKKVIKQYSSKIREQFSAVSNNISR